MCVCMCIHHWHVHACMRVCRICVCVYVRMSVCVCVTSYPTPLQEENLVDECNVSLNMWIESLYLTTEDERSLVNNEWLKSSHIYAAHSLLKQSFPHQNGLCDPSYLAEKFLWSASSSNKFIQIMHVGGNHWVCLSNMLCEGDVVELFDSMHTNREVDDTTKQQAATILCCQSPSFSIRVINVQQQEKGNTCGLFAIAMAFDLCEGKDPFLSSYNESMLRTHLYKCFGQEKISRFPGCVLRKRRRRISRESKWKFIVFVGTLTLQHT